MKFQTTHNTIVAAFEAEFAHIEPHCTTRLTTTTFRITYRPLGSHNPRVYTITCDWPAHRPANGHPYPHVEVGALNTANSVLLRDHAQAVTICADILDWLYVALWNPTYYEEPTK